MSVISSFLKTMHNYTCKAATAALVVFSQNDRSDLIKLLAAAC